MQGQDPRSFRHLTISVEKLPASLAQQAELNEYAAERARLLLGCYRTGDANDPETYVAAIAATLAHFPEAVITQVTHPIFGLPKHKSWLPTVKEVNEACEKANEPIEQERLRRERIAEQMAARKREEELAAPRPTLEEMKAKYGPNWGLREADKPTSKPFNAPSKEDLSAHYREYGLAFQPKQKADGIT